MKQLLRLALILVPIAIFSSVALAAPTIEFEKTAFDFGKLRESEKANVVFSFKNTGDAELEITKVEPSCGCTEAKATAAKISPGGSASIEAIFDSTDFRGKVSKTIEVATNDPAHPEVSLEITGEVLPIATVAPNPINFGNLKVGTIRNATVTVTPTEPESFRILRIEPGGKRVSIPEFRRARDGKGTYYLKISITAGDRPGRAFEQLKIVTDLPGNPIIGFLVFGNVLEQLPKDEKSS